MPMVEEGLHECAGVDWTGQLSLWPTLRLLEDDPNAPMKVHLGHRKDALCLDAYGFHLVSGGADGRLVAWNGENGMVKGAAQLPKKANGTEIAIEAVRLLAAKRLLLAGMQDGAVHLCRFHTCQPVKFAVTRMPGSVTALAASRSNNELVVGDSSGNVAFFDLSDLLVVREDHVTGFARVHAVPAHQGEVSAACALSAPSIVATASGSGQIRLWTYRGEPLVTLGTMVWPKQLPHANGSPADVEVELDEFFEKNSFIPPGF